MKVYLSISKTENIFVDYLLTQTLCHCMFVITGILCVCVKVTMHVYWMCCHTITPTSLPKFLWTTRSVNLVYSSIQGLKVYATVQMPAESFMTFVQTTVLVIYIYFYHVIATLCIL